MFLEELIGYEIFENSQIECKTRLDRENILGWLKTVAGFSNHEGGVLCIGVEDNTNKLMGFSRKEADNERNFFNNTVNEHISPRPPYKIDFLKYKIKNKELLVLKITIQASPVRSVVLKYKGVPSMSFDSGTKHYKTNQSKV